MKVIGWILCLAYLGRILQASFQYHMGMGVLFPYYADALSYFIVGFPILFNQRVKQ